MPVRKTESRLPQGISPNDLGQNAIPAGNPNVILVSFLSSPIAVRRVQNYVVFVLDNAFALTVNSYDWTFNNGGSTNLTTSIGIAEFTPQNTGSLTVTVNLKNNTNATIATVILSQQVLILNAALEEKIEEQERSFPGAAHPDTSREMLNDLRLFVNANLPVPPNDILNKMICSLSYARALQLPAWRRNIIIEDLARILNNNHSGFFSAAKEGFGICKTRPQLLAMFLTNPATTQTFINPVIERASVANAAQRSANAQAIETAFNTLTEENKIDLFNYLRFPKNHFVMTQRIFESLLTRYFTGVAMAPVLAVANNAKKLITEYESGLIAFPVTASPFSNQVFSLINNPVWNIPIATLGSASTGTTVPPPAAATVGIPEKFPSHTFVADSATEVGFSAGSLGFLRMAEVYHDIFGQNPQIVPSFEDLIHRLSTSSTPIARLRVVTHFGGAVSAPTPDGTIFLPFFTDQKRSNGNPDNRTKFWHFAFGISDDEGLKSFFENELLPPLGADFFSSRLMTTTTITSDTPVHRVIFLTLQQLHDTVLTPFSLQNSGNPSAALLTIIKWAASLFMFNNTALQLQGSTSTHLPSAAPTLVGTAIINFINNKINSLTTATGPLNSTNVNALTTRIAGLTWAGLNATTTYSTTELTLPDVYLDNHNTLRTELAIVKNRLNNSFVDIRGCRIGQDRRFLRTLRSFLGNLGNEPRVSGPEWFQGFGFLGNLEFPSEGNVDSFFNSGFSAGGFNAADAQREYSAWSGRIGINSQLSFWGELFNGNLFDFLTLAWRNQLPPIGVESIKLQSLGSANFPAVITTIRDIFKIPSGTAPSTADVNTFNTTFIPQVTALLTIQTAVTPLTNASSQTSLQTQLTAIQGVATAIAQTLPTAPSPLTKDYLQLSLDQLKIFLGTRSGLTPFFTAIKAKLNDPKAGLRYMMGIGIGLLVQSAANEGNTRLVYYTADKENALKSWLKIHWEGPLPATAVTSINGLTPTGSPARIQHGNTDPSDDDFNDTAKGLFNSSLSVDHNDTQTATNPSDEFHQHIITEP